MGYVTDSVSNMEVAKSDFFFFFKLGHSHRCEKVRYRSQVDKKKVDLGRICLRCEHSLISEASPPYFILNNSEREKEIALQILKTTLISVVLELHNVNLRHHFG